MVTVTIRATVNERINSEDIGYPDTVTVTGADALNWSTVQDIAQEAVDSYYGTYGHGYLAVLNPTLWDEMRLTTTRRIRVAKL